MDPRPDTSTITLDPTAKSSQEAQDVRLRVVYPRWLSHEWVVKADVVLGRNPPTEESWQLRHPTISRRHAVLAWEGTAHTLEDLGSHNGTWIDGERLARESRSLRDGTVIRLGGVVLVYERTAGAAPEEAAEVSRDAVPGDSSAMRRL